ncbi:hypothetical protein D9M72_366180 [compost metagenome]
MHIKARLHWQFHASRRRSVDLHGYAGTARGALRLGQGGVRRRLIGGGLGSGRLQYHGRLGGSAVDMGGQVERGQRDVFRTSHLAERILVALPDRYSSVEVGQTEGLDAIAAVGDTQQGK